MLYYSTYKIMYHLVLIFGHLNVQTLKQMSSGTGQHPCIKVQLLNPRHFDDQLFLYFMCLYTL